MLWMDICIPWLYIYIYSYLKAGLGYLCQERRGSVEQVTLVAIIGTNIVAPYIQFN